MNKFLSIILLALLACSTASAVLYYPLPISGRVTGLGFGGNLTIRVTNERTGKTMETDTTDDGEFLVDWANSDDDNGAIIKYQHGDIFNVVILNCHRHEKCTWKQVYASQAELYHQFEFGGTPSIPCPVCPECPEPECQPCPYIECEDCPECEECPEPEDSEDIVTMLFGLGLLGALGVGGYLGKMALSRNDQRKLEEEISKSMSKFSGFRAFKARDGKVRVKHIHKGIVGYHDPQTRHNDPEVRHETGKWII